MPIVKQTEGRARRVTWNVLSLSGSEAVARFFTWITITYTARHWIDVAAYGQYATVVNLVSVFLAFGDLGLSGFTIREVARQKDRSDFFLRNVMALKLFFGLTYYVVFQVVAWVLHYEEVLRWAMLVMGLRLVLDAMASPFTNLLQAHELMGRQGLISMTSSFIRMLGIILTVHAGGGLVGVCWVWIGTGVFSLTASWAVGFRKGWKLQWGKIRPVEAWALFIQAIPFAAFGTLQMIYNRVDSLILKSLSGNEAVAYYDVASRFIFVVFMLSQIFGAALLPALSSARDESDDFQRIAARALKALAFLGLPIAVGGCLLANPLMTLLFGWKYAPAGPAFGVLIPSVFFFFMSRISVNILAIKNTGNLIKIYLSLSVLNIVLNLLLIPRFGFMGASWASLICSILEWLLVFFFSNAYLGKALKFFIGRRFGASLLAVLLMGLGVYADPRLYWLGLGPLVYGLGLYFFGGMMLKIRRVFSRFSEESGDLERSNTG